MSVSPSFNSVTSPSREKLSKALLEEASKNYFASARRVRQLIKAGADVNVRGGWETTPLIEAAKGSVDSLGGLLSNHAGIVKALLEAGADPHLKTSYGQKASAYARENGHILIAERLERAEREVVEVIPPPPPPPPPILRTPEELARDIFFCVNCTPVNELKNLIAKYPATDIRQALSFVNDEGDAPLSRAIWRQQADKVEVLIAAGADVEQRSADGNTPLMLAAHLNTLAIAEMLIAANANLDAQNNNKDSALIIAARENRPETVKALIAAKADINVQNCSPGHTALMVAVWENNFTVVQQLAEAGADTSPTDGAGWSIWDYINTGDKAWLGKVIREGIEEGKQRRAQQEQERQRLLDQTVTDFYSGTKEAIAVQSKALVLKKKGL